MERKQYWPTAEQRFEHAALELRASLAWILLSHNALVAGVRGPDDSQGRATLELLPVDETVARAFALADLFINTALARGEMRPFTDDDVAAAHLRTGELERIRSDAEFPKGRWKPPFGPAAQKEVSTE